MERQHHDHQTSDPTAAGKKSSKQHSQQRQTNDKTGEKRSPQNGIIIINDVRRRIFKTHGTNLLLVLEV
jgi:hypothetical protein